MDWTRSIATRCCTFAVSILAAGRGVAADAGTKPLQSGLVEQVRVQFKLIDAIVVDDRGRTVPGLSRDDFELRIDHVPVAIDSFDVQCASAPIDDVRAVRDARKRRAPQVQDTPRKIVLVLDYPHLRREDRRFVVDDLARVIRYGKAPRDEVMIVALVGSVRVEQRFTVDGDLLLDTLRRMDHDVSLWLPDYEWTTITDFHRSLAALLDSLSFEAGSKAVVLYSKIEGNPEAFRDQLREVEASAQDAQATLYPVYVLGVGGYCYDGCPLLARLASDTGGRLYDKTLDLTIGYARAQRDSGCRYTFGFYTREPDDTRVERIEIVPRRPGLVVLSPGTSVMRSPQEKQRSWLRTAFYFPEALQSPNVAGSVFLDRPKTTRAWNTTLAVAFPTPQFPAGSDSATVDFGGTLSQGRLPVHAFNRRVTLRREAEGTPRERRITFLEPIELPPGAYTLSLVIADPAADRPQTARLELVLPPIPKTPAFLIAPLLQQRAGTDIVLRGDATGPAHDRIGSGDTLQPLVVAEVEATQTLIARTVACGRGGHEPRPATTIDRRLRDGSGRLALTFDPVPFRETAAGALSCQDVVDALPGRALEAADYAFEASLDPAATCGAPTVQSRFVVHPITRSSDR